MAVGDTVFDPHERRWLEVRFDGGSLAAFSARIELSDRPQPSTWAAHGYERHDPDLARWKRHGHKRQNP